MNPEPFDLTRRFSLLAFACVFLVTATLAMLLARLVSERLLHRDAEVTSEFVQSIVSTDQTARFFRDSAGAVPAELEDTFRHFAEMPDVLRTNVYSTDRRAIWSTDPAVRGRTFPANDELDDALAGKLVYSSGRESKEEHVAAGQRLGSGSSGFFEEIYVPVRDRDGKVVGAVELYKTPDALFDAMRRAERTIWIGAALGGVLLYGALIGIVRRANAVMQDQQRRLIEGERLSIVGEMASAVAHSIRNPLASIRTSVELALDEDPRGGFAEPARDIVTQVDRIDAWLRELLSFSKPGSVRRERVDLNAAVRGALAAASLDLGRKSIAAKASLADPAPAALADAGVLEQVLQSIVGNAVDALPQGGRLEVSTLQEEAGAAIVVRDHGPGIAAKDLANVFKPFYTTKARGVGLGLPLARRLVERMGGTLTLDSIPGEGTTVRIALPA